MITVAGHAVHAQTTMYRDKFMVPCQPKDMTREGHCWNCGWGPDRSREKEAFAAISNHVSVSNGKGRKATTSHLHSVEEF